MQIYLVFVCALWWHFWIHSDTIFFTKLPSHSQPNPSSVSAHSWNIIQWRTSPLLLPELDDRLRLRQQILPWPRAWPDKTAEQSCQVTVTRVTRLPLLLLVAWSCPVALVLTLTWAWPLDQPNHLTKLQRTFVGFFSDLKSQLSWHKPMHKRDRGQAARLGGKQWGEGEHHPFGVPPCPLPWLT